MRRFGNNLDFTTRAYLALAGLIVVLSLFPETISSYSPFSLSTRGALPPGADHWLGTDYLGRDILSRTLIGGRISVLIGVISRIGSIAIGLAIGLITGLSRGPIQRLLNGIIEVFLSIPSLLLALALAMVLGESYETIVIAIAVGTWAPVARFVAVKIIVMKNEDFIISARAIGANPVRISLFHLLPSLLPLLIPLLTTGIAASIMMESTLSFLGLAGSASLNTTPSWGLMIQEGSKFIFDAPWIIIPPSVMLMLLILCFNQVGDRMVTEKKG